MEKIPSLFKRDYEGDRNVIDEVVPGSEWVQAGEGVATRKWDGTACMIKDSEIYKRYDAKKGKTPPEGFIPAQEPDEVTGHWPGWVKCDKNNPADAYIIEAFINGDWIMDGTYEAIGPKINGNPEDMPIHILKKHGYEKIGHAPTTYDGLKEWFKQMRIEGIVWHHPDGRMVKIKKKDFGLKR